MDWTTEQILGLAPDQFTLRASRGLAEPHRWIALHQDGAALWGIYPNGSKNTGETAVFLPNFAFTCTCTSQKAPCRHSLGLLLLWQAQAHKFTPHPPLRHLAAWVKREQIKHNRPVNDNESTPSSPQHQHQLEQLKTGLHELELWLTDMMRHGLASLPERPKSYWEAMAHRLVDAQAPALADALRSLAKVPTAQPNWPEIYLKEVGRLYLIVQGFKQFEQLPTDTQADLQTAVGWLPQLDNRTTVVNDTWLVLGRNQEKIGSQTRSYTWLWGQQSQRLAQLIDTYQNRKPAGYGQATNSHWGGSIQFAPGSWPLIATRRGGLNLQTGSSQPAGYKTIRQAGRAYSQALAANPWLGQFPMLLHNTLPTHAGSGWQLADGEGAYLPLPEKFLYGWHLAAIAGGAPTLTLFGIWNGRFLDPLTVFTNNQWQDMIVWRGVR